MSPPGALIVVSLSLPISLANASIEVNSTIFETLLVINRVDNPIRSLIPTPGFSIGKNMRQDTVSESRGRENKTGLADEERLRSAYEFALSKIMQQFSCPIYH